MGMTAEPQLHFSVFVGGVVVHNHVDLFLRRGHMVDHAEELQPFLMTGAGRRTWRSPDRRERPARRTA